MELKKVCQNCRYWKPDQQLGGVVGECRRRSPLPLTAPEDALEAVYGHWPRTADVDFCGEFEVADTVRLTYVQEAAEVQAKQP
ncbi:MAG: hypothetical protein JNM56_04925 [Planctomycetia bacterium]|nr:hypothetical protein [Planctomycetia bacterium]